VGWLIGRRLFFPELGGKYGVGEFKVELVRVELSGLFSSLNFDGGFGIPSRENV
jgi:hypothetical protein